MRINCPHCGERSLDEYLYHGDATLTRPDMASPNAMDEFVSYVFVRTNPPGKHRELWYHSAGCHAWLVVTREIATHNILSVELAKDVALARNQSGKETA